MPRSNPQVVATFSRRMSLRFDDNTIVTARIKGKKLKPVCGDYVVADAIAGESDYLITDVVERRNELTRPNARGKVETLAANIELLIVVAAVTPKPDWFVVDRYLCAAANMGVASLVVFNKIDLGTNSDIDAALKVYRHLEYPVLLCSADAATRLDELHAQIDSHTAIIVGQSGVGKSTVINRLLGGNQQPTAEISTKTREGRHTTVNSVMLDLPGSGRIIDSPGVRDYSPALESMQQVIHGFREIDAAGHDCRFANCRHLREPGCAVKRAVEHGDIDPRRYESYRRLVRLVT